MDSRIETLVYNIIGSERTTKEHLTLAEAVLALAQDQEMIKEYRLQETYGEGYDEGYTDGYDAGFEDGVGGGYRGPNPNKVTRDV